jgi:hypothetical protein
VGETHTIKPQQFCCGSYPDVTILSLGDGSRRAAESAILKPPDGMTVGGYPFDSGDVYL